MKDQFYCTHTWIYYLIIFCILPIIVTPIVIALTKDLSILFILLIPMVFIIMTIIARKYIFAKIIINKSEICKQYKGEIINKIKWSNLVEVKAVEKNCLIFCDNNHPNKSSINNKEMIYFVATIRKLKILSKYVQYFQDKISDISKLSSSEQRYLLSK